jgi:hypothetical protein
LLTSRLMSLHMPIDFQRKPRAWHSSRAVMTSSHPACCQRNSPTATWHQDLPLLSFV